MTGWVLLDRATPISRHVAPFCVEAQEATYVREADLRAWAELPGKRDLSRGMYGNVKRLFPLPEFRATFFGEEVKQNVKEHASNGFSVPFCFVNCI